MKKTAIALMSALALVMTPMVASAKPAPKPAKQKVAAKKTAKKAPAKKVAAKKAPAKHAH